MRRVAVLVAVAASLLAAGCGSSIGDPVRLLPCTPSNNELDQRMLKEAFRQARKLQERLAQWCEL